MEIKLHFNGGDMEPGSEWNAAFMRFRGAFDILTEYCDSVSNEFFGRYIFTIDEGTFMLLALKYPAVAWAVANHSFELFSEEEEAGLWT